MQQRQIAGVLVAIAAVVGGTVAGVVVISRHPSAARPTTSTSSSRAGVTSEDQLIKLIRTQGLTPQRAEELFALDIGPLPGVSVVGIKPDNGFDGTVAADALYGEWKSLSKPVRNAATKLLTPSATEAVPLVARAMQNAALPTTATLTAVTRSVATRRDAVPQLVAAGTGSVRLMNSQLAFYVSLVEDAIAAEAAATQTPPLQATILVQDIIPKNPGLYAEAVLYGDFSTQPGGCQIHVYDPRFAGLDLNTSAGIIAHEVFHCFQERVAETVANMLSVSSWLVEGEAAWVMERLHPGSSSPVAAWTKYAESPLTTYADRSYDALGVYGHLGDILGDQSMVWPLLLPVFHTGIGGHDVAALTQLISGHSQHYFDAWGPSYYEDSFKADWHMAGPGMAPTSGPFASTSSTVNAGATVDIANQPQYVAQDVSLVGDADIVVVVMASGYGEIHDNGYKVDQTLSDTAPVALCLKSGGCKCPNGSPGASEFTVQATIPISLGFDGGDKGLGAYAHGDSLDKYCKHPDPPSPPSSGSSTGGSDGGSGEPDSPPQTTGKSEGDPHFFTFNGHIYDMQAAGEFTLVKSTVDDFDVQTRTVPLPGGRPVAVNQAVATTLGGHRVSLTLENGNIVLRIDGTVSYFVQQDIGGGTVDRNGTEAGTGYVLEWPDGTKVVVDPMGIHGLDVAVTLADNRKGKVIGLLGDGNQATSASFVTSSGVNLGSGLSAQMIDGQYADSWRVTKAESLFDYQPGQSTATFTNKAFPSSFVDANSIPGAGAARQECQADGITDPYLLADCVVDVSSIPDQTVLSHYAQAQVVQTVQYNLAHNLPAFAAPSGQGGGGSGSTAAPATSTPNLQGVVVDSGTVADRAETQAFSFPGQAGEIIWIGDPACNDGGLTFGLVDPNGNTLNATSISMHLSGCNAGLGRFVLPATGTYQLVANADHKGSGSYGLPIRVVRPDVVSQISYGQTVSGTIPETAAHDVYTFQAHAGDTIELGGSGCIVHPPNNPFPVEVVSMHEIPASGGVQAHTDQLAMDCGSPWQLQLSDTYEIIVNSINVGLFSYQFQLLKQ